MTEQQSENGKDSKEHLKEPTKEEEEAKGPLPKGKEWRVIAIHRHK